MRGTTSRHAYDAYLEAQRLFTTLSIEKFMGSIEKYREAIRCDPQFARAYGGLSYALATAAIEEIDMGSSPPAVFEEAEALAKEAVRLDPHDYANHWDLAFLNFHTNRLNEGLDMYERALDLFDNYTDMLDRKPGLLLDFGEALIYAGQTERGVALMERAAHQVPDWYRWHLSFGYLCAREYEKAVNEVEDMYRQPDDPRFILDSQIVLAVAHAYLGHDQEAEAARNLILASKGAEWSMSNKKRIKFVNPADEVHWLEGLRRAGFRIED